MYVNSGNVRRKSRIMQRLTDKEKQYRYYSTNMWLAYENVISSVVAEFDKEKPLYEIKSEISISWNFMYQNIKRLAYFQIDNFCLGKRVPYFHRSSYEYLS